VGFVFEGEQAMLACVRDGRVEFIPDERGHERHVYDPRNPLGSLRALYHRACAFFGTDYLGIILTASPWYDDDIRQSWKDLVQAAGWKWRRTLNTPTVALNGAGFSDDGWYLVCERSGDVVRADLVRLEDGLWELMASVPGHDVEEVVAECFEDARAYDSHMFVTDVLCVGGPWLAHDADVLLSCTGREPYWEIDALAVLARGTAARCGPVTLERLQRRPPSADAHDQVVCK
jgi:predicted nucleic acid-binding Zn ribbon protein